LLNLVVLDVPDHSGQLCSRLEKELRHRIQCSQSRCKEEQQQLLWPKSLSPSPGFSRAAPLPASPYFAASISLASAGLDYIQPRWRTRTRALGSSSVGSLLRASPREFTCLRRYPKYRRNNPPFRFNLLHFARIHVEPL
jgi:hypothetical protein